MPPVAANKYPDLCAFGDYLDAQTRSLPELAEVEDLSPRVTRILGCNPGQMALQGTNTFLVGTGPDKLLIDTGEGRPRWVQLVSELVRSRGLAIRQVLLTHWHHDHTGGLRDLLQLYPDLQTAIYKCEPGAGQQAIVHGQRFSVPGATVRAMHTVGHTADHMCFLLEEDDILFTGDTLLGHGTTAVEDMAGYMTSLRDMQLSRCRTAYPGHGATIPDLMARLDQELGRTLHRERQILTALNQLQRAKQSGAKGSATAVELAHEVFGKLPADIAESVFQPLVKTLLMKLAAEKRVGFEFRGGQKRWFAQPTLSE